MILRHTTAAPQVICAARHMRYKSYAPHVMGNARHMRRASNKTHDVCAARHVRHASYARHNPASLAPHAICATRQMSRTTYAPRVTRAQGAKPKVTVISQWSAGSDGAAISALGKVFEQEGGLWQHSPVPGFTTEMMNKLRAQILAGDPPAASQLKGPEIAAWSQIAPTVDLDAVVAAAGYEAVEGPEQAKAPGPQVGERVEPGADISPVEDRVPG